MFDPLANPQERAWQAFPLLIDENFKNQSSSDWHKLSGGLETVDSCLTPGHKFGLRIQALD